MWNKYLILILQFLLLSEYLSSQIIRNDTTIGISFLENNERLDKVEVYDSLLLYGLKYFENGKTVKVEIFRIDDNIYLKKSYYENGSLKEIGKLEVSFSDIIEGPERIPSTDPMTGEIIFNVYMKVGTLKVGLWQYYDISNNEVSGGYTDGLKNGDWNYYTSWEVGGVRSIHRLDYTITYDNDFKAKVDYENIVLTQNTDSISSFLINGVWRFQSYDSLAFCFAPWCGYDDCKQLVFKDDSSFDIEIIESPYVYNSSYKDNSFLKKISNGTWSIDRDMLILETSSSSLKLKIDYMSKRELVVNRPATAN